MVAPDGSDANVGAFAPAAVVVFGAPNENEPVAAAAPAPVAAFGTPNEKLGAAGVAVEVVLVAAPKMEPFATAAPKANPAELSVEQAAGVADPKTDPAAEPPGLIACVVATDEAPLNMIPSLLVDGEPDTPVTVVELVVVVVVVDDVGAAAVEVGVVVADMVEESIKLDRTAN